MKSVEEDQITYSDNHGLARAWKSHFVENSVLVCLLAHIILSRIQFGPITVRVILGVLTPVIALIALTRPRTDHAGIGLDPSAWANVAYLLFGLGIGLIREGNILTSDRTIGRYAVALILILIVSRADRQWLVVRLVTLLKWVGLVSALVILGQSFGFQPAWQLWRVLNPSWSQTAAIRGLDTQSLLPPGISSAFLSGYYLAATWAVLLWEQSKSMHEKVRRALSLMLLTVATYNLQQRSVLVVCGIVFVLYSLRFLLRARSVLTLGLLAVATIGAIFSSSLFVELTKSTRFYEFRDSARIGATEYALRVFKSSPIVGNRESYDALGTYGSTILAPHNQILIALAYYGLVGLVPMLWIYGSVARRLLRSTLKPMTNREDTEVLTIAVAALLINGLFHNSGPATGDLVIAISLVALSQKPLAARLLNS